MEPRMDIARSHRQDGRAEQLANQISLSSRTQGQSEV